MQQRTIINNVAILDHERTITCGHIKISNGTITEVSDAPFVASSSHLEQDVVHNYEGKLLMPGLVNTHMHMPMSILRGVSDDLPLDRWLKEVIWPLEGKMTREMARAGIGLSLIESIRSGTTAFSDMYHLAREDAHELAVASGLKAQLTRGMITAFSNEQENEQKLQQASEFAKAMNDDSTGRLRGALFPHATYTNSLSFLYRVRDVAEREQLDVQIHIAETEKEVKEHVQQFGKRPVEHLLAEEIIGKGSLLVHSVHVTDDELEQMHEASVNVSHNPQSNLKLGSGIAPVEKMVDQGIVVSLGTDSAASNNTLDVFTEMRQAAMLHKGTSKRAEAITADDAFKMATVNGNKSIGFHKSGLIKEGYDADFILLDVSAPHLQPYRNRVGTVVYAANKNDVTDVYVNGQAVMQNRVIVTLDEEKLLFEANRAQQELLGIHV
ncbi:amidohydrolase [Geomicrobium sediminis]|uniref:5-methylthioadenosine/S-adenosylhomocysteine deaminase n=1 Tax=Geomicrobium sediminis TaxID=1347788 RepID=A0ABS2PDJ6_9BACL|nr:amidohydrolase [Geomicrobium sediminis]MBM7633498.1 5-methylthioadenosine/S-adenosylhomocysteine deaminase [Geomicrobium sediminis]